MKKKLAVLLSLVLVLVAFCAFASAESKLTLDAPNGQGAAVPFRVADKAIDAQVKAIQNVQPARGATVSLWYWADCTGGYIMKTGNQLGRLTYYLLGSRYDIDVISGKDWIGLYDGDGHGVFTWAMDVNTTNKTRIGKIRIRDSYGVVFYIEINQSCAMDIKKVSQLSGAKHDGKVRVQTTKASGTNGKVVYNKGFEEFIGFIGPDGNRYLTLEDEQYLLSVLVRKKYTKGTIWFQQNRGVDTYQYYYMRPYRVLAGKKLEGPRTELWFVHVTH